jgi:starch phosphorylase
MSRPTPTAPKAPRTAPAPTIDRGLGESYRRHLALDGVAEVATADSHRRYEALARTVRDQIAPRWLHTRGVHEVRNAKRVCYLSMEFLLGRSLANNIGNLGLQSLVGECLGTDAAAQWSAIADAEPDAGLGNGGLGRLAACFLESLATLDIPAFGYGLRYEYGIFRQAIQNGYQVEHPDRWLARPDPWEVARPDEAVSVQLACSARLDGCQIRLDPSKPSRLVGIPYDRPVVGFGGKTVNTLRLWSAAPTEEFDFADFRSGDFVGAILDRMVAETVTRVLYPDDSTTQGQALRFIQEYFLVCCSLADIVRRFRKSNADWAALPSKAAAQLNDTHPAMAVAELMRILLDDARLGWDEAFDITRRTLAYTNHTLLPEALEKWPVWFFERICPRHLEIIYEINRRFVGDVRSRHPGDEDRVRRVSLIEESPQRHVRMAHLAVVGTHSTNGVAKIHSELLRKRVLADFAELFPERFNNKTNGVTPRRWLLQANPELSRLITDALGEGWAFDLGRLRALAPLADDAAFRGKFRVARRNAKARFAEWLKASSGVEVDPDSIFDSHVKRIHEYKRQLLNAIHVVVLYNRLRADPTLDAPARTFFFAGKAAPAYDFAKLVIKLIGSIGATIDADPAMRRRLRVVFLPDYNVSLAERLIPATDISEQISTAGFEASGTGNMKFMMNGAITIGTRDGATIEMADELGAASRDIFLFGLTAEQVADSSSWYSPRWHYDNEPETRAALDLIFSDHFSPREPGIFTPIREAILDRGDHYMHLADLGAYAAAHTRLGSLFKDPNAWSRAAIANVAASGRFSSDRTIKEYAAEIWDASACPPD